MRALHKVMRALLEDADAFPSALRAVLKDDLKVSVVEFAEASGIPQPTIYKLLSGEHEPNLRTVRMCVRAIMALEGQQVRGFLAVVAPPTALARLQGGALVRDLGIAVREYPAATVEDAIVSGVWAEREGAASIIALPLEAGFLRRAVTIEVHAPEATEGLDAVLRRTAESVRGVARDGAQGGAHSAAL